jgi:hypothetical protein
MLRRKREERWDISNQVPGSEEKCFPPIMGYVPLRKYSQFARYNPQYFIGCFNSEDVKGRNHRTLTRACWEENYSSTTRNRCKELGEKGHPATAASPFASWRSSSFGTANSATPQSKQTTISENTHTTGLRTLQGSHELADLMFLRRYRMDKSQLR